MMVKKPADIQKPGYRKPSTPSEKRYWEALKPDFREWIEKETLTLDQAAALSMGLDPRCVDYILAERCGTAYNRFSATKSWFSRNEGRFRGRMNLETIYVLAGDNGDDNLDLPDFDEVLDLFQAGRLDADRAIAQLKGLIQSLQTLKIDISEEIATAVINHKTKADEAAGTRTSATDAKIIVALVADKFETLELRAQFVRLKNGERTRFAGEIIKSVIAIFGEIDEATILHRVRLALEDYEVDGKGNLTKKEKDLQPKKNRRSSSGPQE
jgi:hypothetical protein